MMATSIRLLAFAVVMLAACVKVAQAADASVWSADAHARVRLLAGGGRSDAVSAGVEIQLDPGWKTYWRYPGDSGVPPRFDFAGSQNVRSVSVLWPAPHRFSDEAGDSIGYKGSIVFPLKIAAQDATKPVVLHLKLDYAVCEKLCVPAEGRAELALAGGSSSLQPLLSAAEARVPQPVSLGQDGPLAVRTVRRDASTKPQKVIVDVAAPAGADLDLFVEGPTPEWALPLPKPAPGAPPGLRRFVFDLDGVPPGARSTGAVLTLTLVAPAAAIEVKTRLD
ncbi:MAG TPA: protein-disulfide reductase DsbD domain-containing protein [Xanthobacteraceae bacterium]|jgi:DsbC/DsbD-like thiol-disulfide interchange protein|nr:protein-disulfide reductase DsbD domain-containing protein [Xanthobacteraceae bacterium]